MNQSHALASRLLSRDDLAGLELMATEAHAAIAAYHARQASLAATAPPDGLLHASGAVVRQPPAKKCDPEVSRKRSEAGKRGAEKRYGVAKSIETDSKPVANADGKPSKPVANDDTDLAKPMAKPRTLPSDGMAKEGGQGGDSSSDLPSSSDLSSESGSPSQSGSSSPEGPFSLTPTGRARVKRTREKASKCPCPPADELLDAAFVEQCGKEDLPDPRRYYGHIVDIYAKNGSLWAGKGGWQAAFRNVLRKNLDGWPPRSETDRHEAQRARREAREAQEAADLEASTPADPAEVSAILARLKEVSAEKTRGVA